MPADFRISVRSLAKNPAFTLTAVAAIALGIGVNTAIFSMVNAVLLHPAGISDPGRVVAVRAKYDKLNLASIGGSIPDFTDVLHSRQVFEHAAISEDGDFNYTGNGLPVRLRGALVSSEWFDVYGARPVLGRAFRDEDDKPGANSVVVLSYAAWQNLFGGDQGVIGRAIELNEQPYRIIGVMRPGFRWPARVDVWAPLGLPAADFAESNRFNESYFVAARLRDGISPERANAWVQVLANRLRTNGTQAGAYATSAGWGMFTIPMTEYIAGDTRKPLLILLAAVTFVLLIACTNIAGLLLARSSGRARELAVRAALGATRWHLLRQSLTESFLLAAAGALAGLAVAFVCIRLLLQLAPEELAQSFVVQVDGWVLAYTAAIAIFAGLFSGLVPAWQASRFSAAESLKEGGRSATAGRARERVRATLVVAEVALAVVLLAGAGLFLRSLVALEDVGTGFQPQGVMTAAFSLPPAQYPDDAKRAAFFRALLDRLSAMPGARSAAIGTPMPFTGSNGSASFQIEGRPTGPGDPGPHGDVRYISEDYFRTLGIPIRRGRAFTEQDGAGSARVAVIDENLARQYWPNEDPIGKRIRNGRNAEWATIVGLVAHVKHSALVGEPGKGVYYYSIFQRTRPYAFIAVKTPGDPAALASGIRAAMRDVDPAEPVHSLKTMPDLVAESLAPRRFAVTLLTLFAATALFMAALGLYGIISYAVTQRTQEIGVRMALGAQRAQVLGMVIGSGLRLTIMGLVIGAALAAVLLRLLSSQLFGVSAFDPLTFIAVALVLLAATTCASFLPARRAAALDPMIALRYE